MNTKDGERSGYTSPEMPPTPATSHRLKRTLSQETIATTISDVSSSPSLIYPNAPLNTPATRSIAGDVLMSTAADFEIVTDRLQRSSSSPPVSPSSGPGDDLVSSAGSGSGDIDIDLDIDDDPLKEGKAHLRALVREDTELGRQLFKSPERKRPLSKHELLRKYGARTDRSITPTRLSFVTAAAAAAAAAAAPTTTTAATAAATPKPGVLEYTTWGPVAEEDTERALKRMAMLARDEHQKDPSFSVEEYYSMRLAKLIEEAEISFDATHLH